MNRLFILLVSVFLLVIEGFCEDSLKNVRVGYFEKENYQEGSEGTSLYGYAYEYYQRVAQYTGWHYEYVFGSREEIYQKFLRGEVDLMAGFAYSKELDSLIGFPKIPMGRQIYQFLKKNENSSLSTNPASWRGKSFGVVKGAMNNSLRQFLDENKIDVDVKVYNTLAEQNSAFDSNLVDAILADNIDVWNRTEAEIFFRISNSMYFLCVSKKRPDLLNELNRALAQLMDDDPIITARLYNRYLKAANANNELTAPERAWIMAHDTIRIGYLRNLLPYSDDRLKSEDAENDSINNVASNGDLPSGIIKEVIPEMTRRIAFKTLVVKYKGYDAYEEMIADVAQGKQDLAFPVGGHLYWAEKKWHLRICASHSIGTRSGI